MTGSCPPWCRPGRHDDPPSPNHGSHPQAADGVTVMLLQDETWDQPRLWAMADASRSFRDSVLIPAREISGVAAIVASLGHRDLAATLRDLAAQAGYQAEPEPGQ